MPGPVLKFFERQEDARRRTLRLRIAFGLTVLVVVLLLDCVLIVALGGRVDHFYAALVRKPGVIAVMSLFVAIPILWSSWKKWRELQEGGAAIARALGAMPVTPGNRDPGSVRLRNIVEEMSLAAQIPKPGLFVMREERGINAFAAGLTTDDAAVVVTQGALDSLDRAELQAVIGHEFSHVLNGDMAMNLRMAAWLHGLYSLTHLGERIRTNKKGKSRGIRSWVIGWMVTLCGTIGHAAGRVLQAAVSRSREELADASAVQFTRDPESLKSALLKIAGMSTGSRIEADGAFGVAHMFFASGMRQHEWKFAETLLATHPPIVDRLKAIDPSFDARALPRLSREAAVKAKARAAAALEELQRAEGNVDEPEDGAAKLTRLTGVVMAGVALGGTAAEARTTPVAEAAAADGAAPTRGTAVAPTDATASRASVTAPHGATAGAPTHATTATAPAHLAAASVRGPARNIPFPAPARGDGASVRSLEALRQAAQSDANALALALAVVIADEPARRARHLKAIGAAFGAKVTIDVERFATQVDGSVPRGRFLALQRLLDGVRALPDADRERLGRAVRKLAGDDPAPSIFRLCFVEMIVARCHAPPAATTSLRDGVPAFAKLLAVLARAGSEDERAQRRAYDAGFAGLVPGGGPAFDVPADWVDALAEGLAGVARSHPGARRLLRDALGRAVLADGRVTAEESDIARAACMLMDVPPPNFGQAAALTAAPSKAAQPA